MSMKNISKVLISTSSFGKYDPRPLDALKGEGLNIVLNPYGRKLKEEESLDLLNDIPLLLVQVVWKLQIFTQLLVA